MSKDNPHQFQYRYSHNTLEAFKTVDLKRKTKGRPPDLGRVTLPPLYTASRPINKKKIDDLLELLQFVHHRFYQSQVSTGDSDESDSESERSDDE